MQGPIKSRFGYHLLLITDRNFAPSFVFSPIPEVTDPPPPKDLKTLLTKKKWEQVLTYFESASTDQHVPYAFLRALLDAPDQYILSLLKRCPAAAKFAVPKLADRLANEAKTFVTHPFQP